MRSALAAACVAGAVLLTGGCIDLPPNDAAEFENRSKTDVVIRLAGSETEIPVPAMGGSALDGHKECVGERVDVVAGEDVLASFEGGACPTSYLIVWEDGRVTIDDRGTARPTVPPSG
jgi:ABC-type phosphate transport system substrate-binding protein